MLTTKPVNEFLNDLASSSPAPGGGSAAALAGAIGTALTSMVCRLTIGKKKYADVQQEMESVVQRSEELRAQLAKLVDEDTDAFNRVMAGFAMPKESDAEREKRVPAIQEATKSAALVPLNVMRLCEQGLALTRIVVEKGNKNSVSDSGVASLMLQAAAAGAALNVRINLGGLEDQEFVRETSEQMRNVLQRVEQLSREILEHVERTLG